MTVYFPFQFKAVVLYVHPTTKTVALSELEHLVKPQPRPVSTFGDISVGDILESAVIVSRDPSRGVYLTLETGQKAFAYVSFLLPYVVCSVTSKLTPLYGPSRFSS